MNPRITFGIIFATLLAQSYGAAATTVTPTLQAADILLFTSQTTFLGNGNHAAFDTACWTEANGQTVGEEFKAAIADQFATITKPYDMVSSIKGRVVNSLGEQIFVNVDALWPQGPINTAYYELSAFVTDINGNVMPSGSHAWTGSASLTSAAAGADCNGWTAINTGFGIAGNPAVTDANWWNEFFDFCNGNDGNGNIKENSVYCIQVYQGAAVLKDPEFSGFDGSQFEFQGLPNQVFNMISSSDYKMNAKFVPYGHGSFVGAVSFMFAGNELYIDANNTVLFNNEYLSNNIEQENFHIIMNKNSVGVSVGGLHVDIVFVSSYRLDLKFALDTSKLNHEESIHGLIGQTINNIGNQPKIGTDNMGQGVIEGNYVDYLVNGMFGIDCTFCDVTQSNSNQKRSFLDNENFYASLN